MRISKKQLVAPKDMKVTLGDAWKLRDEMYYEQEDDDILDEIDPTRKNDTNATKYLGRDEDFNVKSKLENFEKVMDKILNDKTKPLDKNKGDEIPHELREELDLPKSLGQNEVDYAEVRIKDCEIKRKRPYWSGQDVLADNLNADKSSWIVDFINEVRVWPKGFFGIVKKL